MTHRDPSTNPAIAKPGESSFLIPSPPQTIATILLLDNKILVIIHVIKRMIYMYDSNTGKKIIMKMKVITPIMPKTKDITPSLFPIFFSPKIF